jgi:hypothetical protein
MLMFGVLAGVGIWCRRTPDVHKRFMFLATVSILVAAFARWPVAVVSASPAVFFATTDLFIVAAARTKL